MTTKTMIRSAVVIPFLGLSLLVGANTASAFGGGMGFGGMMGGGYYNATPDQIAVAQTARFQQEATLLGVSVDDVKAAWASGQTMQQLMTAKGITQATVDANAKALRLTQQKTHLQALVDKGVITQAQADARLAFMQTQTANGKSGFGGRGHRGVHMGAL